MKRKTKAAWSWPWGQYTSDSFSVFGVEYYFQSEGYSRAEQRQQRELIDFLNTTTGYAPLDQAFDSYKYLMASEISNTANQGMLQGKHYLNARPVCRWRESRRCSLRWW